MTPEQANEHQRRHGFPPLIEREKTISSEIFESAKSKLRVKHREMNKTEREFSMYLEACKRRGEILGYRFEGIRLLWGDSMIYKPDFTVTSIPFDVKRRIGTLEENIDDRRIYRITLIEVKGAHIFDRDIVRFKGCRAEWRDCFNFEFHQKKHGTWTQLL